MDSTAIASSDALPYFLVMGCTLTKDRCERRIHLTQRRRHSQKARSYGRCAMSRTNISIYRAQLLRSIIAPPGICCVGVNSMRLTLT